jgi:hypothetical protein
MQKKTFFSKVVRYPEFRGFLFGGVKYIEKISGPDELAGLEGDPVLRGTGLEGFYCILKHIRGNNSRFNC